MEPSTRAPPPAFGASREIEGIGTPWYDKKRGGQRVPARCARTDSKAPAVLQSTALAAISDVHARLLAGSAQPAGGLQAPLASEDRAPRAAFASSEEFHDASPGLPEVSARLERAFAPAVSAILRLRAPRAETSPVAVPFETHVPEHAVAHGQRRVGMPVGKERALQLQLAFRSDFG
jgi:hypothetical protein